LLSLFCYFQAHLVEIRNLKGINNRLQEDNQELRDLCCFLDDERQRSQKLAKEWEKFGKYTSSVMRGDVGAYQEKLNVILLLSIDCLSPSLSLPLCVFVLFFTYTHTQVNVHSVLPHFDKKCVDKIRSKVSSWLINSASRVNILHNRMFRTTTYNNVFQRKILFYNCVTKSYCIYWKQDKGDSFLKQNTFCRRLV